RHSPSDSSVQCHIHHLPNHSFYTASPLPEIYYLSLHDALPILNILKMNILNKSLQSRPGNVIIETEFIRNLLKNNTKVVHIGGGAWFVRSLTGSYGHTTKKPFE